MSRKSVHGGELWDGPPKRTKPPERPQKAPPTVIQRMTPSVVHARVRNVALGDMLIEFMAPAEGTVSNITICLEGVEGVGHQVELTITQAANGRYKIMPLEDRLSAFPEEYPIERGGKMTLKLGHPIANYDGDDDLIIEDVWVSFLFKVLK